MYKKNVLMICPWMDHMSSSSGKVFLEQSALLSDQFNFIFVVFKKIGLKEVFKRKSLIKTEQFYISHTNQPIFYGYYLQSHLFSDRINEIFESLIIKNIGPIFKRLGVDFIHAQSLLKAGIFAHALSHKYNIPYIITEHGQVNLIGVSNSRHKRLQKVLDESSKNLLVSYHKISQYAMNRLYGNFEVIGNMVDERIFYFKSKTPDNLFKLITVGAFSPIKDQGTILKALKELDNLKISKNIQFTWVGYNGWGEEKDSEVECVVNSLNFENIKVRHKGSLNREEVAQELQESDLFIFSSLAEGMPLAVMEALACGLPVVSTKWGGYDEILDDNNSLVVNLKDYQAMCMQIRVFLDNKNLFDHRMISENALQNFGDSIFKKRLSKEYNEIIN